MTLAHRQTVHITHHVHSPIHRPTTNHECNNNQQQKGSATWLTVQARLASQVRVKTIEPILFIRIKSISDVERERQARSSGIVCLPLESLKFCYYICGDSSFTQPAYRERRWLKRWLCGVIKIEIVSLDGGASSFFFIPRIKRRIVALLRQSNASKHAFPQILDKMKKYDDNKKPIITIMTMMIRRIIIIDINVEYERTQEGVATTEVEERGRDNTDKKKMLKMKMKMMK